LSEAQAETFLVETPEQLKALTDPLRQRLLERFCDGATIKQAAAALGEKVTKLYHHVDQLQAAGLIRVVREEKVRAVTERTFQSAARRFAVSPSAFAGGASAGAERGRIARNNLEEVLAGTADFPGALRLMRTRARLTEASRERIEAELGRLVRELNDPKAPMVDLLAISARTK